MNTSPFVYGTTVSYKSFTNRENDSNKLKSNILNGINTMIISPRRWGKSSLVEKVINDINNNEPKVKTVLIDLFTVNSEEEFLEAFAKEVIKASSNKWEDWMKSGLDFFKQLTPKLSVGLDPNTDFSLSFDWSELSKHKNEILYLPQTIASKKGVRFIICLDEFQNLASYPKFEAFEKSMRANWQRQKNVTYCLFGSKRHMMSDIFNNPSKPFYKFGDIIFLQRITEEKWVSFILDSFAKTGKRISPENALSISRLMKRHSWYVQQLSHYVWQQTANSVTKPKINTALAELINANTPLYQMEIENMSVTQLNLLKAITHGVTQLTGTSSMQKYRLGTPRNVSKNITSLLNNDIINKDNGGYHFLDPAFELWFKKQYLHIDYSLK